MDLITILFGYFVFKSIYKETKQCNFIDDNDYYYEDCDDCDCLDDCTELQN